MKKTYYYHDLLNDDFAGTNIKTLKVPHDYHYCCFHPVYLVLETLLRILALPLVYLMLKVMYLHRVKNRKVLKQAKGKGYFLYANHTNLLLDAYAPNTITCPRKTHIVVSPDVISIPGIKTLVKMLGALPVPGDSHGVKNFRSSLKQLTDRKRVIAIYPEAHIWPYYTDIRPFGTQSFHYPVDLNLPSFCFTNIYVKRKLSFIKTPKVISYVDGPFYPDCSLSRPERVQKLRDQIYAAMKKRVDENPKYQVCEYVYVDEPEKVTKNK